MKLEGLRLLVEDYDNAFQFYSETLGFKVTWGKLGDVYASFDTGEGIGLSIFEAKYMDEALGIDARKDRRALDNGVCMYVIQKEI